MGKVLVVFKREYLERVRSRWFIVATLLGPVFLAAITILPTVLAARTKTSSTLANVFVLDATGTDLGARVGACAGRHGARRTRAARGDAHRRAVAGRRGPAPPTP